MVLCSHVKNHAEDESMLADFVVNLYAEMDGKSLILFSIYE
jgi:hypothetical protein